MALTKRQRPTYVWVQGTDVMRKFPRRPVEMVLRCGTPEQADGRRAEVHFRMAECGHEVAARAPH